MPKKNPHPRIEQETVNQSSPALLVVTGSPVEADLFCEIGRSCGCELTACRDYWQAGWELTRRRYDLALIDIDLDQSLGLEWLSRLLAIAPGLPIIVLTGDSSREREIASRNRGIAFYFVRPVEPGDLAAIVQHVAHKKTQITSEISLTAWGRTARAGGSSADGQWKARAAGIERRKATDRRQRSSG